MQSKPMNLAELPASSMEMRNEVRYQLDAPALFTWESAQHKRLQGEGITRDISVSGAFILTPTCPPVDVPIQVEVVLPSLTGLNPVIRVGGAARVLRVSRGSNGDGMNGFAVLSEDFSRWSMSTDRRESPSAFAENVEDTVLLGRNGHE